MFGFSKNKTIKTQAETPEAKEARERAEKIKREISIHTMPEKFRSEKAVAGQTKKIGILIIAGGLLIMIALGVFLYWYLFMNKTSTAPTQNTVTNTKTTQQSTKAVTTPPAATQSTTSTPVSNIKNTTPVATTSNVSAIATSTIATSTPTATKLIDKDNDGLSAPEETLLGTNDNSRDTDSDGYNDLSEIMSLYDPASKGKLLDNQNIKLYENPTYKYSIYYSAAWTKSIVGGNDSVIFMSNDNNLIQVAAQNNSNLESINSWYSKQFGNNALANTTTVTGSGWQGLKNNDTGDYYLADNNHYFIFALTYTAGNDNQPVYKNIFNMMVKSLVVK